MAIIDVVTLAKWTQNDLTEVQDDPFAIDLLEKVSLLVCHYAGHPEWHDGGNAPIDIWMLTLGVVKRSYENPGRVIQETTGPLGERVIEDQALFTELTDDEKAILSKYNPDLANTGGRALWTISTDDSPEHASSDGVLYVSDNMQVNIADERTWDIPYLAPEDQYGV